MQAVSNEFVNAMKSKPFQAKITLDGVDVVPQDAVKSIDFTGGSSAEDSGITLGGTVSGSAVITLDKGKVNLPMDGRNLFVELGLETHGAAMWMPMGTYKVIDTLEDDGILTVTANDALAAEFDIPYEPLEGIDFTQDGGVEAPAFLSALCARRGVPANTGQLEPLMLTADPAGYTERQIIGFIAALYGGYADIDRAGSLCICWYTPSGKIVDADSYYENGMEKASYDFTVGWLKCFVEPSGELITCGDTAAPQGIYFVCPWMTREQMVKIWAKVGGFTYRPVAGIELFGDPRLDPGDIVTLVDLTGAEHTVPVMGINHRWDGGIVTQITAKGLAKTDTLGGPKTQEANRKNKNLTESQKALQAEFQNLVAKTLLSILGNSRLRIDGAAMELFTGDKLTVSLSNEFDGSPILYMHDLEEGEQVDSCELSPHHLKLGGTSLVPKLYLSASGEGIKLWLNGEENGKTLDWKPNGDGTYTLIGR